MTPVRFLEGFLVGFHLLLLGHFFNGFGGAHIFRGLRFRFLFITHYETILRLHQPLLKDFHDGGVEQILHFPWLELLAPKISFLDLEFAVRKGLF